MKYEITSFEFSSTNVLKAPQNTSELCLPQLSMASTTGCVVVIFALFEDVFDMIAHSHDVSKGLFECLRCTNICNVRYYQNTVHGERRKERTFCLNVNMHFVFKGVRNTVPTKSDIWTATEAESDI